MRQQVVPDNLTAEGVLRKIKDLAERYLSVAADARESYQGSQPEHPTGWKSLAHPPHNGAIVILERSGSPIRWVVAAYRWENDDGTETAWRDYSSGAVILKIAYANLVEPYCHWRWHVIPGTEYQIPQGRSERHLELSHR